MIRPQGMQMSSRLQWRRAGRWAPATLWEAEVKVQVWDGQRESPGLSSYKVATPHPPAAPRGMVSWTDSLCWGPSLCCLLSKSRAMLSPALASGQPQQEPPGSRASPSCVQSASPPQQGSLDPVCLRAQSSLSVHHLPE